MVKSYSLSMSVLYQTIRTIITNASNNIAALGSFKSKYNAAYLLTLQNPLDAAEAMKSEQARSAEHELLRIDMIGLGADCRQMWQNLKRYIADAYGSAQEVVMWDAAGWQYYTEASNENWDKLREMMQMGFLFIEEHEALLKTAGYMPDDFKDTFDDKRGAFNVKYDAFLIARENAEAGTAAKIAANNAVYESTVSLCLDGQVCFMNDEVKKKLFSIEAVSSLIKPTGSATVVVELRNAETNAVIPMFEMTNLSTERTVSAEEGRAEMGQQAEGQTQYRIVADGYAEHTITVDVHAGVKTIEHVALTPLISEASREAIAGSATSATPEPVVVS